MANDAHSESARHAEIKSVFFSYHFEEDEALVREITKCIERQGLEIVTGERLGGRVVESTVTDRIRSADSLIALLTRRYKIGEPDMQIWDTYPWVRDELFQGYQLGKPAIAIVESGVEVAGAFTHYERITFQRDLWDAAIKKFNETLLLWTGKLGLKPLKLRLSPEQLTRELRRNRDWQCRYRWWVPASGDWETEDWENANVEFFDQAAYFYARRPPDEGALIEVEFLASGETQWSSGRRELQFMIELS